MRTFLAIKSCNRHADRRTAQRSTWLPDLEIPFHFFVGLPAHIPNSRLRHRRPQPPARPLDADVVQLAVDDSFKNIAPKIRGIAEYALQNNFTRVVIVDDDVFLVPARLARFINANHADVLAYLRPDYPQGSCCVYNVGALEVLATSDELKDGVPDDVAVGRALAGMAWTHTELFQPGPVPRLILPSNDFITAHKCLPVATHQTQHSMYSINAMWKNHNSDFGKENENASHQHKLQNT